MDQNEPNTAYSQNSADGESAGIVRPERPVRRHRRAAQDDKYFKIRNVLNIIFMIGAVAGMAVFYFHDRTMGTIIILTAMAFKIAECCFRFIRQ